MINETTLAELLFPHVLADNDFETFHRLACVSKRFNQVSKSSIGLIRRTHYPQANRNVFYVWTELPGHGTQHGFLQHRNIQGQIFQQYIYINGIAHGRYRSWDKITLTLTREYVYNNGYIHGESQEWYPTGQLKCLSNYDMGRLHGECCEWNEGGQMTNVTPFHQGRVHGLKLYWNADRTKKFSSEYYYGQPGGPIKELV